MNNVNTVYVLLNPAGVGVGIPLGVYSSLDYAWEAAEALSAGANFKVERLTLDAPANYTGGETIYPDTFTSALTKP